MALVQVRAVGAELAVPDIVSRGAACPKFYPNRGSVHWGSLGGSGVHRRRQRRQLPLSGWL